MYSYTYTCTRHSLCVCVCVCAYTYACFDVHVCMYKARLVIAYTLELNP